MAILYVCDLCGKVIEGSGMDTSIKLTGYRETFHFGLTARNLQPENHLLQIDHAHEQCIHTMMAMVRDIPNKIRKGNSAVLRIEDYKHDHRDKEAFSG